MKRSMLWVIQHELIIGEQHRVVEQQNQKLVVDVQKIFSVIEEQEEMIVIREKVNQGIEMKIDQDHVREIEIVIELKIEVKIEVKRRI